MKKIRLSLFIAIPFLLQSPSFSQVQVDHAIQLTGSGANARLTGIDSVGSSADAVSVKTLQNGGFIYAPATGSSNNFSININPSITAYQTGMFFNFVANQANVGPSPSTLSVNGLPAIPIKKYVNQDLTGCEILTGQAVMVFYDGSNFQMVSAPSPANAPTTANAGPNQLNVSGTTATLAANAATNGTGSWSIVSGSGGSLSDASSPTSTFTGIVNNTYILTWTITNSCGSSSSNDTVSFICVAPPTNGLVAYWPMNGNVNDSSGNGNNGTATAITYAPGNFGQCAVFNGTTSYISFPDNPTLDYNVGTWSLWINFASIPSPGNGYGLMSKELGPNSYGEYISMDVDGNLTPTVWNQQSYGNTINGGQITTLNTWHHILFTFSSGGGYAAYLDGVLQSSGGNMVNFTVSTAYPLTIGKSSDAFWEYLPNGTEVDEVRIYNRELSPSEIQTLYTSTCQ